MAWEQRVLWGRDHWEITYASQCRELTQLRAEHEWIAAVPSAPQEAALRDLEDAFRRFRRGQAGFPSPRKRGLNASIRFRGRDTGLRALNRKWGAVRTPRLGYVQYRSSRPVPGRLLTTTIIEERGQWFLCLICEVSADSQACPGSVAIDRGVANAVALSTGELISAPARLSRLEVARRRAQRALSRKRKGSDRYRRQAARVAAINARSANIRRDFNHRVSTSIVARFGFVAIEALNVKGMTRSAAGTVEEPGRGVAQKRGLNRSILAQGWGQLESFLGYKLAERGGYLIKVNPAYTSQTCSACGAVDARSRESQARFVCVECGHRDHADVNAAKNILRRSTALLDVEGGHRPPREASTELAA